MRSSATSSGPTSPFSGCTNSPTIRTRESVGAAMSRNCLFHSHSSWHLQGSVTSYSGAFSRTFSACGNMLHFSSMPLSLSVSFLRIWLSRSTSKIDALGDDRTQLRVTASQTATTRGVMVSGVMGAVWKSAVKSGSK